MRRLFLALLCVCIPVAEGARLEHVQIDNSLPARARGANTVMTACHACHGLKYVKYGELIELGLDKDKVAEWRGDQPLNAPLTGLLSDETAMQTFGKIPPDLSLMVKIPDGGADYVYSYLLGYYLTPQGEVGNHVFPETRMPDVLGVSEAKDAAQRTELRNRVADVVAFLDWTADPHAEERHRLGYYVLAFLLAWTGLLYWQKRVIWAGLDKR